MSMTVASPATGCAFIIECRSLYILDGLDFTKTIKDRRVKLPIQLVVVALKVNDLRSNDQTKVIKVKIV